MSNSADHISSSLQIFLRSRRSQAEFAENMGKPMLRAKEPPYQCWELACGQRRTAPDLSAQASQGQKLLPSPTLGSIASTIYTESKTTVRTCAGPFCQLAQIKLCLRTNAAKKQGSQGGCIVGVTTKEFNEGSSAVQLALSCHCTDGPRTLKNLSYVYMYTYMGVYPLES